jgi:alpha-1,3-glucosyltransferase
VVGNSVDCKLFLILSVTSTVSLFPLIPNSLVMIKFSLLATYLLYAVPAVKLLQECFHEKKCHQSSQIMRKVERFYLWMMIPLLIFTCVIHPFFLPSKMPFLPIALSSVYCFLGVLHVFIELHQNI